MKIQDAKQMYAAQMDTLCAKKRDLAQALKNCEQGGNAANVDRVEISRELSAVDAQYDEVELEPVALPERPSEKEIAAALEKEAQPLLKRKKGFTIAMCIEGKQLATPPFAQTFHRAAM